MGFPYPGDDSFGGSPTVPRNLHSLSCCSVCASVERQFKSWDGDFLAPLLPACGVLASVLPSYVGMITEYRNGSVRSDKSGIFKSLPEEPYVSGGRIKETTLAI